MRLMNNKGFTLVEIMIVVAIIALLAAIAIPNFLRARHNANETAAVGNLRTISSACESFRTVSPTTAYPTALTDLSGATPPYIDTVLSAGTKQGYVFAYTAPIAGAPDLYSCTATPTGYHTTGTRAFFIDQSGVIRGADKLAQGTVAVVTDPPIQ